MTGNACVGPSEGWRNDIAESNRICNFFRAAIDRIIDDMSEEYAP